MNQYQITVLAGGQGSEREISLRSGAAVAQALTHLGHAVTENDPGQTGWRLPQNTEVVFLALHGEYGEDGQVQAHLENLGVPYTGTGVNGSRLAFDKQLAKDAFLASSIPTPKGIKVRQGDPVPESIDGPWVLKPARQGSSVGLQLPETAADWDAALNAASAEGEDVLCEERIIGREITVGLLADEPLPIVEVCPKEGTFDFTNKYTEGATEYICPAELPADREETIRQLALDAFRAVEGRDFGRVDMMLDGQLNPYVLEVNTLPGMTETSLLPKAAFADGIDFNSLCGRMVELAMERN